jgi:hypothetical protein
MVVHRVDDHRGCKGKENHMLETLSKSGAENRSEMLNFQTSIGRVKKL